MDQLRELCVSNFPFFVFPEMKLDELAVEAKGNFSVECCVFYDVFKFIYGTENKWCIIKLFSLKNKYSPWTNHTGFINHIFTRLIREVFLAITWNNPFIRTSTICRILLNLTCSTKSYSQHQDVLNECLPKIFFHR